MSIDPPKQSPPTPANRVADSLLRSTGDKTGNPNTGNKPATDPLGRLLDTISQRSPPQIAVTIKAIQSFVPSKEPVIELVRDPTLLVRALVAGKELLLATRQLPPVNQPLLLVANGNTLSLQPQPGTSTDQVRSELLQQLQQLTPFSRRPLIESIRQLVSAPTAPPATSNGLNQQTLQALQSLLDRLPTPSSFSSPTTVREQLLNSGLHLEQRLLQLPGTAPVTNGKTTLPGQSILPTQVADLKALLLTTLQSVATNVSGLPSTSQPLLQLLQSLLPSAQAGAGQSTAYSSESPPPPPPSFPQFAQALLPAEGRAGSSEISSQQLMLQLATALARIQTQQVLSGLQQQGLSADPNGPLNSWLYELPVRNEHQVDSIQLLIEQYADKEKKKQRGEPGYRWQINLAFEIAPLAPFQALLSLIDNRASIAVWADEAKTLQLLSQHIGSLRGALVGAGVEVEELRCKRGLPVPQKTRLDRSLVDIHT
ncbi:flagellar hook-length control protein FliK [Aestuariirhabdus sp. Z084]|uniref:flagellar hook-length control protein FliK n=1 Tax=Aestuariirhabdus haliotis TaxID=2918751 RepID=UPI00201B4649|nr:flagellar hook-length control protein FliK [Aestuariirhabdus haliotis]MCL6415540.1 flagellar hook-length control protein FliK [Aestuariirhabdus haliotis]MCL6419255.1 flagellar hook-length control protein FliK [Aestuariirhabdus haliotis]